MRLPAALKYRWGIAGQTPILRTQIGPASRSEAKRLAQQLAFLCQAICTAAAEAGETGSMDVQLQPDEADLVSHVINACQNAIAQAIAEPSRAIGLAKGLGEALTSLQVIQSEVGKGAGGAPVITAHADALTRSALGDVLKLASQSDTALAALAKVESVAPKPPAAPNRAEAQSADRLPLFSEVSQAYIDMRIKRDGPDHADISTLALRRQTFIDVIGDRPVDKYFPSHLQDYVNQMQYWPANVIKRGDMQGKPTLETLESNRHFEIAPAMAKKTMADGYLANIRTMMRHRIQDLNYRDPFAGAKISYPQAYRASKPREGVSKGVINRVFSAGVESGLLDEAIMPLFAKLTSRRLGLLTFLQGPDIRKKDEVWVAQTKGIVEVKDETTGKSEWRRVPIKTGESMPYFVLHNFLVEIGFVDWARQQPGFIFEAAHEHTDPSKYMSKVMQNHLDRCGALGGEVFHSLRGDAIDKMRKEKVDSRSRRLQSGHELGDEHDKYGFRALSSEECEELANKPLQAGINWDVFRGLDFEAMSKRRRSRGRRPKST